MIIARRKKHAPLVNDTEGVQDNIQDMMLSITSRLEMIKSVEQVLGAGLTDDIMIKSQLQNAKLRVMNDIKKMTAYGVPLFDVLGRLGSKIYEARLIDSGKTIDDYFRINGQYKVQDFVSEDALLKDQMVVTDPRLKGINQEEKDAIVDQKIPIVNIDALLSAIDNEYYDLSRRNVKNRWVDAFSEGREFLSEQKEELKEHRSDEQDALEDLRDQIIAQISNRQKEDPSIDYHKVIAALANREPNREMDRKIDYIHDRVDQAIHGERIVEMLQPQPIEEKKKEEAIKQPEEEEKVLEGFIPLDPKRPFTVDEVEEYIILLQNPKLLGDEKLDRQSAIAQRLMKNEMSGLFSNETNFLSKLKAPRSEDGKKVRAVTLAKLRAKLQELRP